MGALKQSCSLNDIDDVLEHLLKIADEAQKLATLYHQSASDACPMECTEAENYEASFETFVANRYFS